MSYTDKHTTADIAAIRGELELLKSIVENGGMVSYRAAHETCNTSVINWLKENHLYVEYPDSKIFNMQYSELQEDEDDPQMISSVPKYNMVCFATQDKNGFTFPKIYFIPKDKQMPDVLNVFDSFIHCTYESENDMTGAEIVKWLKQNSNHIFDQHTINKRSFVIASSDKIDTRTTKSLQIS